MPYLYNTPEDQKAMLDAIGAASIEELFAMVPPELRLGRPLDIPPALSEMELTQQLSAMAARNGLAGLSMGMSDDMEAAIAEGATMVRIGTAIFGAREGARRVA